MFSEIYRGLVRLFQGPAISHHNHSVSKSVKKYMTEYFEVDINSICYSIDIDDLILMTYDDTDRNIGIIMSETFLDGRIRKILAIPYYQCVDNATADDVLFYIAITVIASVASLKIHISQNSFIPDMDNFSYEMLPIYCYAPAFIYCNVIKDLFHNTIGIEKVYQQYLNVLNEFFEINEKEKKSLFDHDLRMFKQNMKNFEAVFVDIYNTMNSFYRNHEYDITNQTSFIYEFLDCSMFLVHNKKNPIYIIDMESFEL